MTPRLLVFTLAAAAIMSAQVKLPPYSKKALPNGATLILLNKPDVPLVTVRRCSAAARRLNPPRRRASTRSPWN